MEQKTKIDAREGRQELLVTREFDLPVELLYQAFVDAEIVEQWMGTKVLKLENQPHGSWQFETKDAAGNVVFRSNGVFHRLDENRQIVRTFEMENTPFPVQLEFLDFESLGEERSKLSMQMVFRSVEHRDQMLRMPFARGINMAHARLEEYLQKKMATR